MKIADIANLLGYYENSWTGEITGIQYDSRKVEQGDLFVCLRGVAADGHDFCRQSGSSRGWSAPGGRIFTGIGRSPDQGGR